MNFTTLVMPSPKVVMVVTGAPPELRTVMALPLELMGSLYVPGYTMMTSPLEAALIAAWMVEKSVGTPTTPAATSEAAALDRASPNNDRAMCCRVEPVMMDSPQLAVRQ